MMNLAYGTVGLLLAITGGFVGLMISVSGGQLLATIGLAFVLFGGFGEVADQLKELVKKIK